MSISVTPLTEYCNSEDMVKARPWRAHSAVEDVLRAQIKLGGNLLHHVLKIKINW